MSSAYENLQDLKGQMNIVVEGAEKYPKDKPTLVVANHTCLMDIFYLPASLPELSINVVSARVLFKRDGQRQNVVNKYLYALPIESNGGSVYSRMGLEQAIALLKDGYSLNMFPEGVYFANKTGLYYARTGMARILFACKAAGVDVQLVPVAIDIKNDDIDLDNYYPCDDVVRVEILDTIDYTKEYYAFAQTEDYGCYREVVDRCLWSIADSLDCTYSSTYTPYPSKHSVIFANGEIVSEYVAQSEEYVTQYEAELNAYTRRLRKKINSDRKLS